MKFTLHKKARWLFMLLSGLTFFAFIFYVNGIPKRIDPGLRHTLWSPTKFVSGMAKMKANANAMKNKGQLKFTLAEVAPTGFLDEFFIKDGVVIDTLSNSVLSLKWNNQNQDATVFFAELDHYACDYIARGFMQYYVDNPPTPNSPWFSYMEINGVAIRPPKADDDTGTIMASFKDACSWENKSTMAWHGL